MSTLSTHNTGKKIAVCRTSLLPISETFIKTQMLAFNNWHGQLVGGQIVNAGLSLDGLEYFLYKKESFPQIQHYIERIQNALNLPSPALVRLLRKLAPDLVHVHFGTDATWLWPSIKQINCPVVITLHGYDITTHKSFWKTHRNPRFKFYPERLLALAKDPKVHFIAVSKAIRQRAIEFGIPAEKITVKYIGIDVDRFTPGPVPIAKRENRILFVGRLAEKKGVMYLLEALAKVITQILDVRLVIAGDGPQRGQAEQYANEHALPVDFLGSISHEQVQQEMARSRIFCLPSITASTGDREGLPIVIKEAQACGVPVVTSAHGGATEGIIHGKTGFAFEEKNVQALSQYLIQLLNDDELLSAMSHQAPSFVKEQFDIKKCTAALEEYYDDIHTAFKLRADR